MSILIRRGWRLSRKRLITIIKNDSLTRKRERGLDRVSLDKESGVIHNESVFRGLPLPLGKRIDARGKPGRGFPIMQNLKTRLDPDRLLNPGRFVGGI